MATITRPKYVAYVWDEPTLKIWHRGFYRSWLRAKVAAWWHKTTRDANSASLVFKTFHDRHLEFEASKQLQW